MSKGISKIARSVVKRKCGTCLFWSMWTGTCCEGGDFKERAYDDKACGAWDQSEEEDYDPSLDSASYDPEDEQ